ncbi:MAG: L-fuculokinase [Candidatus Marinimicrobia bacterium]|nr:L-fuculokinase [Candidatus Neomarinimicrobiota bacterium]
MLKKDIIIVLDIGATNVRAVAINSTGKIEAIHALPNGTQPDPFHPGGLIWDVDEIWQKLMTCLHQILPEIAFERISALTVTTFGVNGAPVDSKGNLLYPVISWQCQRTEPIMRHIDRYIPLEKLYQINGVNAFSFNTINVLLWFRENKPDIIEKMAGWLFIPSIFVHRLTGRLVNDMTMAGTSMLTDFSNRQISKGILIATGLPDKFFEIREAGTIAGNLIEKSARETGLPAGIPVVLTGHDTQFALIGSGVGENEPILSSGTWEILMARCRYGELNNKNLQAGLTNEFDALPGLINSGTQWLASGILEWVKRNFYCDLKENVYETMIRDAENLGYSGRVRLSPDFVNHQGAITGIGLQTSRAQVYYAALEALTEQTAKGLKLLEKTGKFKAKALVLVGGGSKNNLWNRLRADRLGIPVKISNQTETTVLGASLFGQVAIGNYSSIDEAVEKTCQNYQIVAPSPAVTPVPYKKN